MDTVREYRPVINGVVANYWAVRVTCANEAIALIEEALRLQCGKEEVALWAASGWALDIVPSWTQAPTLPGVYCLPVLDGGSVVDGELI